MQWSPLLSCAFNGWGIHKGCLTRRSEDCEEREEEDLTTDYMDGHDNSFFLIREIRGSLHFFALFAIFAPSR
jgi:hypothetical protein